MQKPKRKSRKKLSRKSQNLHLHLNLSVRQLGQGVEVLAGEDLEAPVVQEVMVDLEAPVVVEADNQVVVEVHLGVEVLGVVPVGEAEAEADNQVVEVPGVEVEVPEVEVVVLGVVPVGEVEVEAEAEAVEVVVGKEESCKIPILGKEILTETYHSKPASTSLWWMRSPTTRPKSKPKFKTSLGK